MHTPLVLGENGEKLSKQNGAEALDVSQPLLALEQASQALGLPKLNDEETIKQALQTWIKAWSPAPHPVPR